MRLSAPRIEPLGKDELDPAAREVLAALPEFSRNFNIFRTLARNPDALQAFLGWGNYVLSARNSLTARHRELAILRTGWLCRAGYEWAQHVEFGRRSGISDAEVKGGAEAPGWDALEAAILKACDELIGDRHVSDATWLALAELGDRGRMDLVFTVGQYTQVSMMLNAFGVQLDPDLAADPALTPR
jgi:alkylhydroperoxidase family enzyme